MKREQSGFLSLRLDDIPVYGSIMICLAIHVLMDISVTFNFLFIMISIYNLKFALATKI